MKQIKQEDNEVALVIEKIAPIVAEAQALKIIDETTLAHSAELLSQHNQNLDWIKKQEETITAPAKLIIKTEQARWESAKDMLKTAVVFLRGEQSRYQTELTKKEAKIASRTGEGKGHLKIETAVAQISALGKQDKVVTESGSVSFIKKPTLKITDASLIPKEYLIPDESKIFTALKAGLTVAGCEIEIISISRNNR
jgi:membrane-bound lytic murein transglycosylase MltF